MPRVDLAATVAAIGVGASAAPKAIGKPGITPAPCPDQSWEEADATFAALPGARVSFGHDEGGTYRIEIPDTWNGELVLWAHGYTASAGAQGPRLRVGVPGVGQGSPLRQHLVEEGFAWAASSYRCNGYVPGRGLLDTMALTDVFTKLNEGRPPRVSTSPACPWAATCIIRSPGSLQLQRAGAGGWL